MTFHPPPVLNAHQHQSMARSTHTAPEDAGGRDEQNHPKRLASFRPRLAKPAPMERGEEQPLPQPAPLPPPQWLEGDARDLSSLPGTSVDLVVTSPPYWHRRDYGHVRQLGQEPTPRRVTWQRSLRRAGQLAASLAALTLRSSSTLGDTYRDGFSRRRPRPLFEVAVRRAGWKVANHIVWTKSIGRPEPRPYRLASRHEVVFHLTRAERATQYFFDLFRVVFGSWGGAPIRGTFGTCIRPEAGAITSRPSPPNWRGAPSSWRARNGYAQRVVSPLPDVWSRRRSWTPRVPKRPAPWSSSKSMG